MSKDRFRNFWRKLLQTFPGALKGCVVSRAGFCRRLQIGACFLDLELEGGDLFLVCLPFLRELLAKFNERVFLELVAPFFEFRRG